MQGGCLWVPWWLSRSHRTRSTWVISTRIRPAGKIVGRSREVGPRYRVLSVLDLQGIPQRWKIRRSRSTPNPRRRLWLPVVSRLRARLELTFRPVLQARAVPWARPAKLAQMTPAWIWLQRIVTTSASCSTLPPAQALGCNRLQYRYGDRV